MYAAILLGSDIFQATDSNFGHANMFLEATNCMSANK